MAGPVSFVDYVRVTTATVGTGAIALGPAEAGFRGVDALSDAATYSYSISQPDDTYEVGYGVFSATGANLVRLSVSSSSSGGMPISLTGRAVVTFTILAAELAQFQVDAISVEEARLAADADAALALAARLATQQDRTQTATDVVTAGNYAAAAAAAGPTVYADKATGNAAVADGAQFRVGTAGVIGDGIQVWTRESADPTAAHEDAAIIGPVTAAQLLAEQEQECFALGFAGGTLDTLITFALLDQTSGQFVEADCSGFGQLAVRYLATSTGSARIEVSKAPGNVTLAGGSFVSPGAVVSFGTERIYVRPQRFFSQEPATANLVEDSFIEYTKEHTVPTAQYVIGTPVVTLKSTGAVLTPGVSADYIVRNAVRSGALFGENNSSPFNVQGGAAVSVAYQGQMQRAEWLSTDRYGTLTLTPGQDVWKAASMWEPQLPVGNVPVFRIFRSPGKMDFQEVFRYRNRILIGDEQGYNAERAENQRLLGGFRGALFGRRPIVVFGLGDSTQQLGGAITPDNEDDYNLRPNGFRCDIGYFAEYDAPTRAKIPQNTNGAMGFSDGIYTHMREGPEWTFIKNLYDIFGDGTSLQSLQGWGENDFIRYENWGVGGTDSSDKIIVDPGPPPTSRYCILQPDHMAAWLADLDAMVAAGRYPLFVVRPGLNELGSPNTYANLMTLIGILRAPRPGLPNGVQSILLVQPTRQSPTYAAIYEAWLVTCDAFEQAARDANVALCRTYRLFKSGGTAAMGLSERELCNTSFNKHFGLQEGNAEGDIMTDCVA